MSLKLPSAISFFCLGLLLFIPAVRAETALEKAEALFQRGEYEACLRLAETGLKEERYRDEWPIWSVRCLMTLGRYPEAETGIKDYLRRYRGNLRLRLLARDVFLANGNREEADRLLEEINSLGSSRSWAYRDPCVRVVLGEAALLLGLDPKAVLDQVFDPAKKADPGCRDAYAAIGQLALEKHDYDLAAKSFRAALEHFPKDPDFHYGLAAAFDASDREEMLKALQKALSFNPQHLPSLQLMVEHQIDAEQYDEAAATLKKILSVNPWLPEAWSYRSILDHLRGNVAEEEKDRETALKYWDSNPRVDFLIGKKLSQKYRFQEGAAHQRKALAFDQKFLPAKIQLAEDLLRLGEETEGWKLAQEVHDSDNYDVTAFNLVTLHDSLDKFQTLTNADFVLRMSAMEAPIYGSDALELLTRAKTNLTAKYGIALKEPTIVEMFADQKDFGVRTFGMPDNPGFLGVCFGRVVTANSPAATPGHPANWQAVLWHEFCHVVTLTMTENKMPRWLSEGISVYEERQANPSWGQSMSPDYRERILEGKVTPVGELSAAFLNAHSGADLQFAYFESSLVVEFLVQRFGLDALKKVLLDLKQGEPMNTALAKRTAPLDELQKQFTAFAREKAEKLAPGLDWAKPGEKHGNLFKSIANSLPFKVPAPDVQTNKPNQQAKIAEESGKKPNFYKLSQAAADAIEQKKWDEAKPSLQKLIELFPGYAGPDSAYAMLAAVHRAKGELAEEKKVLSELARRSDDVVEAYLRLAELCAAEKDWAGTLENAERLAAVNPLLPACHRYRAMAADHLGQAEKAIVNYETLLKLDPPDPAEIHFRLAELFHGKDDNRAKRHLIDALEMAPRFRKAHALLLELHAKEARADGSAAAPAAFE